MSWWGYIYPLIHKVMTLNVACIAKINILVFQLKYLNITSINPPVFSTKRVWDIKSFTSMMDHICTSVCCSMLSKATSKDLRRASWWIISLPSAGSVTARSWCAWRASIRRSLEKIWSMRRSWGSPVNWPTISLSSSSENKLLREAGEHPSDPCML